MVDSDQVRIEIRGFFPGSVVVNFTVIFTPSQNQGISNVSTALLQSLMNSTKYTVDQNNTSINGMSLSNLCSNNVCYEIRPGRYETRRNCLKCLKLKMLTVTFSKV